MKVNELTELYELYRSLSKAIPVKKQNQQGGKTPPHGFYNGYYKKVMNRSENIEEGLVNEICGIFRY